MGWKFTKKVLQFLLILSFVFFPLGTVHSQGGPPGVASPDLNGPGGASGAGVRSAAPALSAPWAYALQAGADRLTATQNNDGGWDWPLDDGDPATGSASNTVAPIAMGLARAYEQTGDPAHRAALQQAGAFLLTKTNNFSPADGYLAAQLDAIFGGTTYVDHVTANFYTPLANGTYDHNGAGTLYDTASFVQYIRDRRAASGIPNLAAWDLGMGLVAAASAGADTTEWIAGVKAEINELDSANYYDVIGLAGALYGLAFVGEDFDPTAGAHVAAANIQDLFDILVSYQISSGGFTWNAGFVSPGNETVQETAYALLALQEFDAVGYAAEIQNAATYLRSVQLASGGWENYTGWGENNEVTGEALWAVSYEDVSIPLVVYNIQTKPSHGSVLTQGPTQITVEFSEDVVHDGSAVAANNTANYLLVEAGANGNFDTTSCAVPGGTAAADDVLIAIDSAVYQTTPSFMATLGINGGAPLPEGKYRLFVCGTTSIENFDGIKLNNGEADSLVDFTVRQAPTELPATGFAPGRVTQLPQQPVGKAYTATELVLEIPSLGVKTPIVGVPRSADSWDVSWLGESAGWLEGSAFPTWNGNTVLTGHVWDADNTPGVFFEIKNLRYGDKVYVHAFGLTYVYEVRENHWVWGGRNPSAVLQHEEMDWVTLLTCEAYNPLTGNYFLRRVVRAVLVEIR